MSDCAFPFSLGAVHAVSSTVEATGTSMGASLGGPTDGSTGISAVAVEAALAVPRLNSSAAALAHTSAGSVAGAWRGVVTAGVLAAASMGTPIRASLIVSRYVFALAWAASVPTGEGTSASSLPATSVQISLSCMALSGSAGGFRFIGVGLPTCVKDCAAVTVGVAARSSRLARPASSVLGVLADGTVAESPIMGVGAAVSASPAPSESGCRAAEAMPVTLSDAFLPPCTTVSSREACTNVGAGVRVKAESMAVSALLKSTSCAPSETDWRGGVSQILFCCSRSLSIDERSAGVDFCEVCSLERACPLDS
mmetsp:Transcript_70482/g.206215  ORF Transcript_70482/g.206215 Transcript_70482/m.206215 type:complete len:310 (+) Transcript_70482:924-1853(+)